MADHRKWLFASLRDAVLRRSPRDSSSSSGSDSIHSFQTVSMAQDGISWTVEKQLRWTTCVYIEDLATLVEIPSAPCVLAQLYVQRFYSLHAFSTHDRFLVATAALFLAAKSEEFPIKVRLMTECGMFLLLCKPTTDDDERKTPLAAGTRASPSSTSANGNGRRRKSVSGRPVEMSASLGNDPEAANAKHLDCLHALLEVIDVGQIETTAARVLLLERVVLQTLEFDLSIPQPFAYVPRCMEKLFALEAMHPSISYDSVRSLAVFFLNDAVKSGAVLAFDSVELGTAAVYLACLYRNHVSPNVATEKNEPWWSVWGLSAQQLEDAARGILWIYEDAEGKKHEGLSEGLLDLWDRYLPQQNMPDLEYIKQLDADLQRSSF